MQKLIIKEMNVLRRESGRSGWIMLLMVVCGLVVGGFLGELLGKYFPILKYGYNLGVSAHEWNFHVLRLTFGLDFNINMFSILGIVIAIYIYRRL
jgi:predicted membrane chloride channel (bestrophin family)